MLIRKNCPCDIDNELPYREEVEEYKMDLDKLDSLASKLWNYVVKNNLARCDIEYIYTKIIHKYSVTFHDW